jgi:hypothetical protein
MSRWASFVIGGLMIIGLGERLVASWSETQTPVIPPITIAAGHAECLARDVLLGALVARGETATPEPPPACATGPAQSEWYLVTEAARTKAHLAFDAAGCLVPEAGAACAIQLR